ncbi:hypothetical protein AND4_09732 [Vibrio sp. AND4]|nr:hypothetical protein AND4_09732 [Vibrio sp. AND4]
MLSTVPVALKPNSQKWRLLTTWQGLSKMNKGKAHRNAANVATRYLKSAVKKCRGVNTALGANPQGSDECATG